MVPPDGFDDFRAVDAVRRLDEAGADIAFGGRIARRSKAKSGSSRSSRRHLAIGAVAVLVVAIAVVERDAGNDASPSSAPATVPSVRSATTTVTATTTAPSVSSRPQNTPLLANSNGWGLFIAQQDHVGSIATVERIDLASGTVGTVARTFTNGFSVLVGKGTDATVLTAADLGGATQAVPGPNGALWVIDDSTIDPTSQRTMRLVQPHPGASPEVVSTIDVSSSGISYLAGSTAAGDPVYSGPDGTYFEFDPVTNNSKRVASGAVMSYEDGNYSTIDCDDVGHCTVSIHGPTDTLTLDYFHGMEVSIAPDGTHALVGNIGGNPNRLNVVDLHTGTSRSDITLSGVDVTQSFSAAWTPDSSAVIILADSAMLVVPVAARQLGSPISLPADFLNVNSLLGIA